jgi:hypothetical protein
MTSQPDIPDSDELKDILRAVFDAQIPNFGSYNLVYGGPGRRSRMERQGGGGRTGYYVVGYRWQPAELVIAPFNVPALTGADAPTAINMTNLSHAVMLPGGGYEAGTSTGRTFRFSVPERAHIPGPGGLPMELHQEEDCEDFHAFMAAFIDMA